MANYFKFKFKALKSELGWQGLIGMVLMILGFLLFLPGSVIIGYFSMTATFYALVMCPILMAVGFALIDGIPKTAHR